MRRLRTILSRPLPAIIALAAVLAVTGGIAQAALSGAPAPEPEALDRAAHDALTAPRVEGITARVTFTNDLLPAGALPGRRSSPLVSGAEGRVWIAADGRFRLELQSSAGDAQVTSDGKRIRLYDPASDTVYAAPVPDVEPRREGERPTLADVRTKLARLAELWTVSGAQPGSTGGRPSYTVRLSPKDDGGLLGAAELAWDAARGVPLRAAVYAQGQDDPVLELAVDEIDYGAVATADLTASPPAGAKVVEMAPHKRVKPDRDGREVEGAAAVQRRLDFTLAAPDELAGLPRRQVRLVDFGGTACALSVYGEGLGAIVVLQREAEPQRERPARPGPELPKINVDGATGTELATALGTILTFERGGVSYTVAGSVPPVAAENAARGLE